MKLHYYPETDSLYIELRDAPGADAREISDGVVADFGADGALVGIDIGKQVRSVRARDDRRSLEGIESRVGLTWASTLSPARASG